MLFTSLEFLFVFLPITLTVNLILHPRVRNYWLLMASLFFYAWGEPKFVLVMLLSILINYTMALLISAIPVRNEKSGGSKAFSWIKKLLLILTIGLNLSILFVYKYMNFTTATIVDWFPSLAGKIAVTEFVLPIGISFFTFQAMSYVVDVYRGEPVQKNPAYVALYVSLFPQLIAGPIVRYTTVAEEINHRVMTVDDFSKGVMRFLYGFNKKMLLANVLAKAADAAFAAEELSVCFAWLGGICYSLQIFFDFSGYSEMAIGLGQMMGFHFLENFDYPYISKTITEFWRRWHMSLGTWFRDYLYFPLGGSRVKSRGRLILNLAVVWFATGVWHGANWTFILWGVLYGVILIAEKLLNLPKTLPSHKVGSVFYRAFTLLAILCGWVLFRAENLEVAGNYLLTMFGLNGAAFIDDAAIFNFREYLIPLIAGILCSTPIFKWLHKQARGQNAYVSNLYEFCDGLVQIALFMVGVSYLVMNAHNPFIYFNF